MDGSKTDKLRVLMRELGAARGEIQGLLGDRPAPATDADPEPSPRPRPSPEPSPEPSPVDGAGAEVVGRELGAAARRLTLANMSHELRTPLNGVLGSLESLEAGPLNASQRDDVATIRESAEALLATITNLLDHVELETEGVRLADESIAVRPLLNEVTTLCRQKATRAGLRFHEDIDASVPEFLRGDGSRLRQIFTHLLGNAVKFTPEGQVSLRVATGTPGDDTVELHVEVEDTGVGIPEEECERLFAPFTQLDSSSRRRFGGAGLGLSISRRLVEQMGGQIKVHSTLGEGTRFLVTLRLRTAAPGGARPAPEERPAPRGRRILVVDDNGTNRKVASAILAKLGHEADTADSGPAALEKLAAQPFDLVLMDVQMPEMDGLETTQAIRAEDSVVKNPEIAVLALTAHTGQGDRERFLAAGMNDYLAKPVNPTMLRSALDRWLPVEAATASEAPEELELPVFDREGLLERVGGDEELMGEVVEIFLEETPDELAQVRSAAEAKDMELLRRAAHTVKGAARNVGALRLGEVAYAVETAAKEEDLPTATALFDELDAEFAAYQEAVA